ncbi:shikimate dehydrogenase [Methylobacterium isbiliense]|jgi:shikimate dehydrogenase|uniref:Shikimate dehydrogenase (NADP(+)) n=1 Tax=Methylobacterium isbiliense TaxID=315478 RepID=A0ABQ4SJL9_9HYPH|nr:shikimate dehydrogenase [Methylobacterium isbiliense]MDN3626489.1 shikimate dehydrogenase [Methylobacterium isbiliense]GJE03372.1 Shikimate dehydrogenase (NADP(+)) [Methylobacterium isbiliense]
MTSPRKAFVVGHPIAHSRSPLIHGHWLSAHGLPGSYERIDVGPEAFPAFLAGLREAGFVGGNVTIPHKEAAYRLVDIRTPRAERIGAVNTLSLDEAGRLVGDNTDATGFVAHLDATLGADWLDTTGIAAGRPALLLGAGGAARAIAVGLLDRGVPRLLIANRTAARAEALRALDPHRIGTLAAAEVPGRLAEVGLLVNTTSLGMAAAPGLPADPAPLPPEAAVADIVYVPLDTPLLAAARARDLRTVDGLGMLLHQAVPGFARWFGVTPQVTPALRALIVADIEGRR